MWTKPIVFTLLNLLLGHLNDPGFELLHCSQFFLVSICAGEQKLRCHPKTCFSLGLAEEERSVSHF